MSLDRQLLKIVDILKDDFVQLFLLLFCVVLLLTYYLGGLPVLAPYIQWVWLGVIAAVCLLAVRILASWARL